MRSKKDNSGCCLECIFYLVGWFIETLLIKYWIGVDSWLYAIVLAVTVGSLVLIALQHLPDILD